jgi:Zn finger protein HypA/HybF involved in hydrogenase expression
MNPSKPSASRAETAARIAANPTEYKVCEGCDSIVGGKTAICPNCHSFRFDVTADRVVRQARLLGAREQRSVTAHDLG